jgi:hypothetical protein
VPERTESMDFANQRASAQFVPEPAT